MTRRSAALRAGVTALIAGALHVALGAYACGDPIDGSKGPGEPCTRTEECAFGLVCGGGICREHDAGPPPLDAGHDAGESTDAAIDDAAVDDAAVEDAAIEDGGDADASTDDAG